MGYCCQIESNLILDVGDIVERLTRLQAVVYQVLSRLHIEAHGNSKILFSYMLHYLSL